MSVSLCSSPATEETRELPSVRLPRGEYDLALLKAGMGFNGSLQVLIRRALAEYQPAPRTPKACPECHKAVAMKPAQVDETLTTGVTVTGIPTGVCPECGTALRPPIALLETLEEILRGAPGSTVSFADLLR